MWLAVEGSSLNVGLLNATTSALSAYMAEVLTSSGQSAQLLSDDFPFPTLNASQVMLSFAESAVLLRARWHLNPAVDCCRSTSQA